MKIKFYIDPATDLPHIYNNNISEKEVDEIIEYADEDRSGKDGSRVAVGQTAGGRFIRVVYVPDTEPQSIFVVTAYELRGKPLAAFRRRRRK